jgi:predicted PurR-regulated permease PerM
VTGPEAAHEHPGDRRRVERRTNARVGDLTLPEARRILVTTALFVIVLALFLWMVSTVIIAGILGVVIAFYARPLFTFIRRGVPHKGWAAILTLTAIIIPVLGALAYSYFEISSVTEYLAKNQDIVAAQIDAKLRQLPFFEGADTRTAIRGYVARASDYGTAIPSMVQEAVASFAIATTIFIFTAFYFFTDAPRIVEYVRGKIPPRYSELVATLDANVRGVLYGAIYATLLTQLLKSVIILVMLLVFRVPLAGVLAIVSFIIGFFPIVGSWSVYVPVAAWLLVFRDDVLGATVLTVVGFLLNTVFISMYVRPKLAAEKSRVLNFYWMFVGLVTGVYTFGLAGILLGPILIGLLKAVVDTVTTTASWRLVEREGLDDPPPGVAA